MRGTVIALALVTLGACRGPDPAARSQPAAASPALPAPASSDPAEAAPPPASEEAARPPAIARAAALPADAPGVIGLVASGGPSGASGSPAGDPTLRSLARAAAACPWRAGVALDCPDYARWLAALAQVAAAGGDEPDATLVALTAAAERATRWLAAEGLVRRAGRYRADPGLAAQVVAALWAERDAAVAAVLGRTVARAAAAAPVRVEAALRGHPLAAARAALAAELLVHQGAGWAAATEASALTDPDVGVRLAALGAFRAAALPRPDRACALWRRLATDPQPQVAARATALLAQSPRCAPAAAAPR